MKVSYAWLKKYFDELPSMEKIDEALALHAFETEGIEKIGDDEVLDVDVLPNRAGDCLSHRGIAGEIATIFDIPIKQESYELEKEYSKAEYDLGVNIENSMTCRRFTARVIENIEIKESPQWLRDQLDALGQRSINNVVDATNYVMFDLGQPTHVFDASKIEGNITIRRAAEGERIRLLGFEKDDKDLVLNKEHVVVADDGGALSLAGVKGGQKAELGDVRGPTSYTTSIVLEAGSWDPLITRKTARGLSILTDASKRFENEPTQELTYEAIEALTKRILEIAETPDTAVGDIIDEYPVKTHAHTLVVSLDEINGLLGTALTFDEVKDIWQRLRFDYNLLAAPMAQAGELKDAFDVAIPLHRRDLNIKEDLIEEVGRVYGYDHIETIVPEYKVAKINPLVSVTSRIRHHLLREGFSEIITYSFLDKGKVEMENALASDKGFVRDKEGIERLMLEKLEMNSKNTELFGLEEIKLFELGTIWEGTNDEQYVLTLGVHMPAKKAKPAETLEHIYKNVIRNIYNALDVFDVRLEGKSAVVTIRIDDILSKIEISKSYLDDGIEYKEDERQFYAYSQYPFVLRDIAVWVPEEKKADEVRGLIRGEAGNLLVNSRLFDEFKKDGRVSYAFRLVFQSMDKTLSDEEVNGVMKKVETVLAKQDSFEVR